MSPERDSARGKRTRLRRWLGDPLLHFVLLGALIFGFFAVLDDGAQSESRRIVVSAEEIASLWQAMAMLYGEAPSEEELYQLVEPRIREEVLYREALALGLDEDDSQIRQRLVEKMTFLTDDLFSAGEPSEAEIEAFFENNRASFEEPARAGFEQLYFSPSEHGENLMAVAEDALRQLSQDPDAALSGDASHLAREYESVTEQELRGELGEAFAAAVFALEADEVWHGPLRSQFGAHLVRVSARAEAHRPALEEVREQVVEALVQERRREANDAAYARLRARYEIVIEIPDIAQAAWQR